MSSTHDKLAGTYIEKLITFHDQGMSIYEDPFGLMHCMTIGCADFRKQVLFFRDPLVILEHLASEGVFNDERFELMHMYLTEMPLADGLISKYIPFVSTSIAVVYDDVAEHLIGLFEQLEECVRECQQQKLTVFNLVEAVGIFNIVDMHIGEDRSRSLIYTGFDMHDYHGILLFQRGVSRGDLEGLVFGTRLTVSDEYLFGEQIAQWKESVDSSVKIHDEVCTVQSGLISLLSYMRVVDIRKSVLHDSYFGFQKLEDWQLEGLIYYIIAAVKGGLLYFVKQRCKMTPQQGRSMMVDIMSMNEIFITVQRRNYMQTRKSLAPEQRRESERPLADGRNVLASRFLAAFDRNVPDWAVMQAVDLVYLVLFSNCIIIASHTPPELTRGHRLLKLLNKVTIDGDDIASIENISRGGRMFRDMAQVRGDCMVKLDELIDEINELTSLLPGPVPVGDLEKYFEQCKLVYQSVNNWTLKDNIRQHWLNAVSEVEGLRDTIKEHIDSGQVILTLHERYTYARSLLVEKALGYNVNQVILPRLVPLDAVFTDVLERLELGLYMREDNYACKGAIDDLRKVEQYCEQLIHAQEKARKDRVRKQQQDIDRLEYEQSRAESRQATEKSLCEKKTLQIIAWVEEHRPEHVGRFKKAVSAAEQEHTTKKGKKKKIRYSKVLHSLDKLWNDREYY